MSKWPIYLLVSLGALIAILGVVFVSMYIWEAIISRSGEPDQSLIFWYLPILFLGVLASMGGAWLFMRGFRQIKSTKKMIYSEGAMANKAPTGM